MQPACTACLKYNNLYSTCTTIRIGLGLRFDDPIVSDCRHRILLKLDFQADLTVVEKIGGNYNCKFVFKKKRSYLRIEILSQVEKSLFTRLFDRLVGLAFDGSK